MTGNTNKTLEIRLFATLRNTRFADEKVAFPVSADIRQVLDQLSIPAAEAAIILVNGRHGDLDTVPEDGDAVAIFPPVGGG